MVVLIRDFGNITTSTLAIHSATDNISSNNNSKMVVDSINNIFENTCNNYDEVRGCSLALSAHHPCPQVTVMRTMQ